MKLKKMIRSLIVASLLVCLCGCGKESEDKVSTNDDTTATVIEVTTETITEATSEATEAPVQDTTEAATQETTEITTEEAKQEVTSGISDAQLQGVWSRTDVHSGHQGTIEITNQDAEGFDFDGEFCYYSHIGNISGRAYYNEEGKAIFTHTPDFGEEDVTIEFAMEGEHLIVVADGDSALYGFGMNVYAYGTYTLGEPEYTNGTVLEDNFTEEELDNIKAVLTEEYYYEYFEYVVTNGALESTNCTLEDGTKAVFYVASYPTMAYYNLELLMCDNGDIYFYSNAEEVGWKTNVSGAIDYPDYTSE